MAEIVNQNCPDPKAYFEKVKDHFLPSDKYTIEQKKAIEEQFLALAGKNKDKGEACALTDSALDSLILDIKIKNGQNEIYLQDKTEQSKYKGGIEKSSESYSKYLDGIKTSNDNIQKACNMWTNCINSSHEWTESINDYLADPNLTKDKKAEFKATVSDKARLAVNSIEERSRDLVNYASNISSGRELNKYMIPGYDGKEKLIGNNKEEALRYIQVELQTLEAINSKKERVADFNVYFRIIGIIASWFLLGKTITKVGDFKKWKRDITDISELKETKGFVGKNLAMNLLAVVKLLRIIPIVNLIPWQKLPGEFTSEIIQKPITQTEGGKHSLDIGDIGILMDNSPTKEQDQKEIRYMFLDYLKKIGINPTEVDKLGKESGNLSTFWEDAKSLYEKSLPKPGRAMRALKGIGNLIGYIPKKLIQATTTLLSPEDFCKTLMKNAIKSSFSAVSPLYKSPDKATYKIDDDKKQDFLKNIDAFSLNHELSIKERDSRKKEYEKYIDDLKNCRILPAPTEEQVKQKLIEIVTERTSIPQNLRDFEIWCANTLEDSLRTKNSNLLDIKIHEEELKVAQLTYELNGGKGNIISTFNNFFNELVNPKDSSGSYKYNWTENHFNTILELIYEGENLDTIKNGLARVTILSRDELFTKRLKKFNQALESELIKIELTMDLKEKKKLLNRLKTKLPTINSIKDNRLKDIIINFDEKITDKISIIDKDLGKLDKKSDNIINFGDPDDKKTEDAIREINKLKALFEKIGDTKKVDVIKKYLQHKDSVAKKDFYKDLSKLIDGSEDGDYEDKLKILEEKAKTAIDFSKEDEKKENAITKAKEIKDLLKITGNKQTTKEKIGGVEVTKTLIQYLQDDLNNIKGSVTQEDFEFWLSNCINGNRDKNYKAKLEKLKEEAKKYIYFGEDLDNKELKDQNNERKNAAIAKVNELKEKFRLMGNEDKIKEIDGYFKGLKSSITNIDFENKLSYIINPDPKDTRSYEDKFKDFKEKEIDKKGTKVYFLDSVNLGLEQIFSNLKNKLEEIETLKDKLEKLNERGLDEKTNKEILNKLIKENNDLTLKRYSELQTILDNIEKIIKITENHFRFNIIKINELILGYKSSIEEYKIWYEEEYEKPKQKARQKAETAGEANQGNENVVDVEFEEVKKPGEAIALPFYDEKLETAKGELIDKVLLFVSEEKASLVKKFKEKFESGEFQNKTLDEIKIALTNIIELPKENIVMDESIFTLKDGITTMKFDETEIKEVNLSYKGKKEGLIVGIEYEETLNAWEKFRNDYEELDKKIKAEFDLNGKSEEYEKLRRERFDIYQKFQKSQFEGFPKEVRDKIKSEEIKIADEFARNNSKGFFDGVFEIFKKAEFRKK